MKTFYNLFLVAALFISASAFSQGLTVDTYSGKAWPWETWGDVMHGDTIEVEGSFTQTIVHNADTTFTIQSVTLSILQLDGSWNEVNKHLVIAVDSEHGDLASGTFKHKIVIPTWFPLTADADADAKFLLQTRANYTYKGEVSTVGPANQFSNAWITVVDGGLTAVTPADPGLTVETYSGKAWPWETWGEVAHGETIPIQGSYSQEIVYNADTTFEVAKVVASLLQLDANWDEVTKYEEIVADANNGDLKSGIINWNLVVPADFPLSSTAPDDKWLIQTRAYYTVKGKTETTMVGTANQFSNAWMTVVEGGGTAISDVKASQQLAVYPNPVQANQTIRVSSSDAEGMVQVSLFDLAGKRVYSNEMNANNMRIETSNLNAGVYTLMIVNGNTKAVRKVLVQ